MIQLKSQAIKEMVTRIIPKKLIELVYSHYGTVPLDDLKFITIIRDTGLTYEFFIL